MASAAATTLCVLGSCFGEALQARQLMKTTLWIYFHHEVRFSESILLSATWPFALCQLNLG